MSNKGRARCEQCLRRLLDGETNACLPWCAAGWRRESLHVQTFDTFDDLVETTPKATAKV